MPGKISLLGKKKPPTKRSERIKIFVIRHGDYTKDDGKLSQTGKQQIQKTAEKIQTMLESGPTKIYCSGSDRARESADILSSQLGISGIEIREVLGEFDGTGFSSLLDEIRSGPHRTVILVTHQPEAIDMADILQPDSSSVLDKAEFYIAQVNAKAQEAAEGKRQCSRGFSRDAYQYGILSEEKMK